MTRISNDFAHLARLALSGRPQDVQLFLHRAAKRYRKDLPELADQLTALLREAPTRSTPLRRQNGNPVPVDADSRLHLVRLEHIDDLPVDPIFAEPTAKMLNQLVRERQDVDRLNKHGLAPTRSALFVGPPGVGKTLSARWLAKEMRKPLLILDLSAVMSSFLGKTGNNLRQVLDYAKSEDCILFLDEIDAVAKRRDDATEIGELKRLVTVLLQEIDDWPETGLMLAATNHPTLLDSAVWRSFEMTIEYLMPEQGHVKTAIERYLGETSENTMIWKNLLSGVLKDDSFSEIEHQIKSARRAAIVNEQPISKYLEEIVKSHLKNIDRHERMAFAEEMIAKKIASQRQVSEITGVSRDTLRKMKRDKQSVANVKEASIG